MVGSSPDLSAPRTPPERAINEGHFFGGGYYLILATKCNQKKKHEQKKIQQNTSKYELKGELHMSISKCMNCLCKFCTRYDCKYQSERYFDPCYIRCGYKLGKTPRLVCSDFHNTARVRTFKIVRKGRTIDNLLRKMSAADLLALVGGGISEIKGGAPNNRK